MDINHENTRLRQGYREASEKKKPRKITLDTPVKWSPSANFTGQMLLERAAFQGC
jgi:hypothetical protein